MIGVSALVSNSQLLSLATDTVAPWRKKKPTGSCPWVSGGRNNHLEMVLRTPTRSTDRRADYLRLWEAVAPSREIRFW